MLFFRSEEMARQWCLEHDYPLRPLVRMDQLWILARSWYATRLQADARRPAPEEIARIFLALGLSGDFWDLSGQRAT